MDASREMRGRGCGFRSGLPGVLGVWWAGGLVIWCSGGHEAGFGGSMDDWGKIASRDWDVELHRKDLRGGLRDIVVLCVCLCDS